MKRDRNEYPSDAADVALLGAPDLQETNGDRLVSLANKPRNLGGIRAIDELGESINAQA
jgi:hypothetical protein